VAEEEQEVQVLQELQTLEVEVVELSLMQEAPADRESLY
jgi:hypothetical protein